MDEKKYTILTVNEYARRRGVKKRAVQYAVEQGLLRNSLDRTHGGKTRIKAELADQEWTPRNTNKNSAREKIEDEKLANGNSQSEPTVKDSTAEVDPDTGEMIAMIEPDGSRIPLVAKSRARIEFYKAEQERLDFEKKLGNLVNADEVRQSAIKIARAVRDSLMNIPDRLSAELAAESDVFKINQRLSNEIRKCLESLKNELE